MLLLKTKTSAIPSPLKSPTKMYCCCGSRARHRTVVAGDELKAAAAVIGEDTEIGHHPVGSVEDEDLVLAVVIEIAGPEAIARLELP